MKKQKNSQFGKGLHNFGNEGNIMERFNGRLSLGITRRTNEMAAVARRVADCGH